MNANLWLAAIAASVTLSCTAAPPETATLKLAGTQLLLEEQGAVCYLKNIKDGKRTGSAISLGIPAPCAFHKDKAGKVRMIRKGKYDYALVESSKRVGNGTECETHLRSVRADDKQFQISQHKDKVASCPPFQWESMSFTELFD